MLLNPVGEKGKEGGEGGKRRRGKSGESTGGSTGGNSFEGIGIGPIIACVSSARFDLDKKIGTKTMAEISEKNGQFKICGGQ